MMKIDRLIRKFEKKALKLGYTVTEVCMLDDKKEKELVLYAKSLDLGEMTKPLFNCSGGGINDKIS